MAGPNLPTNTDATYSDLHPLDSTDTNPAAPLHPGIKAHQQQHDTAHGLVNQFDTTIATALDGQLLRRRSGVFVPEVGLPRNYVDTNRSVTLADLGCVIEAYSPTGQTRIITVPTDTTLATSVGDTVEVFRFNDAVQITAESGVTFRIPDGLTGITSLTVSRRHGTIRLCKRAANTWVAEGDITEQTGVGSLLLQDEGGTATEVTQINVTGAGATASVTGGVGTIDVPGTTGSNTIEVQDEGGTATAVTRINVTGAGASISAANFIATLSVPGGGAGSAYRSYVLVAGNNAPQAVKDAADYIATGTNDQTTINTALIAATRSGDGLGGTNRGGVLLVGDFNIGNNGTGVIQMPPAVTLMGAGIGTLLIPQYGTYGDRGCIESLNTNSCAWRVTNLSIGKIDSSTSRCHGIKIVGAATATAYGLESGNDYFIRIDNVHIYKPQGKGVWTSGSSGGARETQVYDTLVWDSGEDGIRLESSDNKVQNCVTQTGSGGPGFYLGGGNSDVDMCKTYYSDGSTDGFQVVSSRAFISNCKAQDCGRWGLNMSSTQGTVSGFQADSNARTDTSGGGINIASNRAMLSGVHVFDRAQSANQQMLGIAISSGAGLFLTGRVEVPTGGTHISGTPGSNSHVRLVRGYSDGSTTTVYSVG